MSREQVMAEIHRLQEEFPGLAAVSAGNVIDVTEVETVEQ